jgi:Kef-type K+ transport system membrane component KefB
VIVLLFQVGLEIQLFEMVRLGGMATAVAVVGVVTPFALGFGAARLLGIGEGYEAAIFLGAALTATSVGITARVFRDLKKIRSDEARVVIGAAVVDDVIGLMILAVVSGLLGGEGEFTAGSLAQILFRVVAFLVVAIAAGAFAVPHLLRLLDALRVPGSFIVGAVSLAIALGLAAEVFAGLDPIVGAFVAGLIIGRPDHVERIERELQPIAFFFVPIFFLAVGAGVDVGVLLQPEVLASGLVISLLAALGKIASGAALIGRPLDKLVVGVGMIPRGEVGLIFAALGAGQLATVVGPEEVAIVVLMVIVTTVAAPIALNPLIKRLPDPGQPAGAPSERR